MGEASEVVSIVDFNGNPVAGVPGSAISAAGVASLGTDGTNGHIILVDSSGRQVVAGPGTAGSPAGGVLSVQGVASGQPVIISGTFQPVYGSSGQSITCTLNSLASAGARQSTAISNTTTLAEDAYIFVTVATASSGVSATGYIAVYGYGSVDGTNYGDTVTGTDGTITLTVPPNLQLIGLINAVATSKTYKGGPWSFCRQMGFDRLPSSWGIVVVNNSGAALAASGNSAEYQTVSGQVV